MAFAGADGQFRIADVAIRRRRHAQDRLQFLGPDVVALFQAGVKTFQNPAGPVHGVLVAGHGYFVSLGVDGDIQFLLDPGKMAVMRAEQLQRQDVVGKHHFGALGLVGGTPGGDGLRFRRRSHGETPSTAASAPSPAALPLASAAAEQPERLLAWAAVMRMGCMVPNLSSGASMWTACM